MNYKITLLFTFFLSTSNYAQEGWFWQNPLPQGNTLYDIFVFDQNTVITVGGAGTVMKTNDGGMNWNVQHNAGGTSYTLSSVHFIDANTGWSVGGMWGEGVILKTTDGGTNWICQKSDISSWLKSVYFVNSDTGWAVGDNNLVLITIDGGQSWNVQYKSAEMRGHLSSVYFIDSNNGWAVGVSWSGSEGKIIRTTNGGHWWKSQTTSNAMRSVYFTDADTGWAVGRNGAILKTIDGGVNWVRQASGTSTKLFSVFLQMQTLAGQLERLSHIILKALF